MASDRTFDELLDAILLLPVEQQADLLELVRRRIAERGRQQIIADTREARDEYRTRKTKATSVDDLLREIES